MVPLRQELRYSLRMLRANPGFTIAAVACLALGMGATTAVFSVVNAVVVRPLPYPHSEQLVRLYSEFPNFPGGGLRRFWISPPEFLDLRRDTHSWQSLDAWAIGGANLLGSTEPVRATEAYVTGGMMRSLGASPLMGRTITPADDEPTAPCVAMLSYGLWRRAFGGDPHVLGRDIRHDGSKCTVIAVMPRAFQFPPGEVDPAELWVPLQLDPAKPGGRGSHYLSLLGRLKAGVPLRQAQDELAGLVRQAGAQAAPNTHTFHPKFHPIVSYGFKDEVVGSVRPAMLVLMAAVVFVLLIACVNVANLLLARAESRQREIALRTAMGATLTRLLRQFVVEGLLLSIVGAALGTILAYGGVRLIAATNAGSIPRVDEIGVDVRVLLFTLLISVGTGLFFGLSPVSHMRTRQLAEALKASSGRSTSTGGAQLFRRILVVAELSLAMVLLIGSGLMVRAFWKLQQVDAGIRPAGVLTMRIPLTQAIYTTPESAVSFWSRLQARLAALPGVESASFATGLPPARPLNANDTQIEGFVQQPNGAVQNVDYWQTVGKRYFETMGIHLIDGRLFDDRDGKGAPAVVIVNQSMARHFWGSQSPVGKRVRPGFSDPWRTVVGVVADVKNGGLDKPAGTELYFPYEQLQSALSNTAAVLRAKGDPQALIAPARAAVRELDPGVPVSNVRTMDEVLAAAQSRPRFLTLLLTIFSSVALVLAAVGIYGVISYSVAQRTSEIGIRIAIGAQTADVLRMVLAQGARLGAAGVLCGAVGALALTRTMRGLLFGISSFDPVTFAWMALLLAGVTLLACYVPARRAAKVDPIVALRYD